MTAALIDDVVLDGVVLTAPAAPVLALAPQTASQTASVAALHSAPRPARAAKLRNFEPPSDPMADVAGQLLSIPLRHVYAALWRAGVIKVKA
jgi:hypothetical protein